VTIVHKLNQHITKLRKLIYFSFALIIIFANTNIIQAKVITDTNDETGYQLVLDDQAGYFSDSEITDLRNQMKEITAYCNVAVVTTESHNSYSTESFAADYYDSVFGSYSSGTIFVIDRYLNEIFLYSDGSAHKTITDARAYSITDNTYIYATASHDRDYYTCTYKTLEQVLALMEGRRIAEPMKYICSALLAIIIAMLVNYFIAMHFSRTRKANVKQILAGTYTNFNVSNPNAVFVNQTRTYSPQSSGGGGGGHGGGGGGGHSGGGGGHSI
jgi:uncharacterized protein